MADALACRHLRGVLLDNPVVTDANRDALVEALRSIAELMIWGDQHEPRFLDYFLENNLLQHFVRILQQRSNRQGGMAKQVLQTLSILIQVSHAGRYELVWLRQGSGPEQALQTSSTLIQRSLQEENEWWAKPAQAVIVCVQTTSGATHLHIRCC